MTLRKKENQINKIRGERVDIIIEAQKYKDHKRL